MDLPSHVLWMYATERIVAPTFVSTHPNFVIASLIFSALPDIIESAPFLIYLVWNKAELGLKDLKSVIKFSVDIGHNRPSEYEARFPWASKLSFYTHSFLLSAVVALIFYLTAEWLFLPFVVGYSLHLLIDVFLHNDYFSARPLYPLNNLSISGLTTWYKAKNFSRYNYGLLLVIYLILLI